MNINIKKKEKKIERKKKITINTRTLSMQFVYFFLMKKCFFFFLLSISHTHKHSRCTHFSVCVFLNCYIRFLVNSRFWSEVINSKMVIFDVLYPSLQHSCSLRKKNKEKNWAVNHFWNYLLSWVQGQNYINLFSSFGIFSYSNVSVCDDRLFVEWKHKEFTFQRVHFHVFFFSFYKNRFENDL